MKNFEVSFENVVATATLKDGYGKPAGRGELASAFGMWPGEKSQDLTPEALKGWATERIKLLQKWISNLTILKDDCTVKAFAGLTVQEMEALLEQRKSQQAAS